MQRHEIPMSLFIRQQLMHTTVKIITF